MYRRPRNSPDRLDALGKLLALTLLLVWQPACAQTAPAGADPIHTAEAIADLVAPVALYPDDLLAIVLPASTYPLQIVQAQRFLEAVAADPSLKPDDAWDDSVVALLNYPEVVKLMNDDLDWTVELGQALLAQQPEVIAAIEGFRKRTYTAGNLRTDDRQVVEVQNDAIFIRPANPQVIYVPYYEPARMTVYHRAPVYYYYPRPYPVYYYPYPVGYTFSSGYFWGVTSYFSLGWNTRHLHVYPYDYHYHPYYGRPHLYQRNYYYRRAPIVVNNHYYGNSHGDWDRQGDGYPPHRDRDDRNRRGNEYERERDGDRNPRHQRDYRADTYWQPDHRRTGARPGTDPQRNERRQPDRREQRLEQRQDRTSAGGWQRQAPAAPTDRARNRASEPSTSLSPDAGLGSPPAAAEPPTRGERNARQERRTQPSLQQRMTGSPERQEFRGSRRPEPPARVVTPDPVTTLTERSRGRSPDPSATPSSGQELRERYRSQSRTDAPQPRESNGRAFRQPPSRNPIKDAQRQNERMQRARPAPELAGADVQTRQARRDIQQHEPRQAERQRPERREHEQPGGGRNRDAREAGPELRRDRQRDAPR